MWSEMLPSMLFLLYAAGFRNVITTLNDTFTVISQEKELFSINGLPVSLNYLYMCT
jgi:hypothetical protein